MSFRKRLLGVCIMATSAFLCSSASAQEQKEVPVQAVKLTKNEIRIGFPESIFRSVPPSMVRYTATPFNKIVLDQTGFTSLVTHDGSWLKVAEKLNAGDYEIAVFLGHEFAWAKEKYPELEPLIKAVPMHRNQQAFLVVRYDSTAKTIADLKQQKVALPGGFVDLSILFYQSQIRKYLGEGKHFETVNPESIEDALNEVASGNCAFTVADSASWNYFKSVNPGRASNLKILAESEVFPLACIAYRKGHMSDETLRKLKEGMSSADTNPSAKALLRIIKLQGFEAPTEEYNKELKKISEAYPVAHPIDLTKLK